MLERLTEHSLRWHDKLADYKGAGKKLCGYVTNLIPEELIYAAGMIPIRLESASVQSRMSDGLLQDFVCEHCRGCLEAGLSGLYQDLEGTVFTRTCDAVRNLYTLWANNTGQNFSYYLSTPGNCTEKALPFFTGELSRFKHYLEAQTGKLLTEESLTGAVKLFNRIRRRLKSLILSGRLSGVALYHLYHADLVMDPAEYAQAIEGINPEDLPRINSSVRVAVSGSHFSDPGIVEAIEGLGLHVAVLDLDFGFRRFWHEADEAVPLLDSLARRYIRSGALDPSKHPTPDRIELLASLLKEIGVSGVIVINQKYCDPYLFEIPAQREFFEFEGLPSLFMTSGERLEIGTQFQNRIEAFGEILAKT